MVRENCPLKYLGLFGFVASVLLFGNPLTAQNPYFSQLRGEAWLDLVTGKVHLSSDLAKPSGPVIWGRMEGKYFAPSRMVDLAETAKQPDPQFAPGWIDLQTGLIYQDSAGQSPKSPYLSGRIHPKGFFLVYPEELHKWLGERLPTIPKVPSVPPPEYSPAKQGSLKTSPEKPKTENPGTAPVGSPYEKPGAVIRSLEGESATVTFQPGEIIVDKTVTWKGAGSSLDDNLTLGFAAAEPQTLQMELFLESESNVYESHIRKLEQLTLVDRAIGRPPKCEFTWGPNFPRFEGVLESLNVRYTHFLSDGTPVRATVNLRMKQAARLLTLGERIR